MVMASALLTHCIPWADLDCTDVTVAASMDMDAIEAWFPAARKRLSTKVTAAACLVPLRPCTQVPGGCANVTFGLSEGPRGIHVVSSSLAK